MIAHKRVRSVRALSMCAASTVLVLGCSPSVTLQVGPDTRVGMADPASAALEEFVVETRGLASDYEWAAERLVVDCMSSAGFDYVAPGRGAQDREQSAQVNEAYARSLTVEEQERYAETFLGPLDGPTFTVSAESGHSLEFWTEGCLSAARDSVISREAFATIHRYALEAEAIMFEVDARVVALAEYQAVERDLESCTGSSLETDLRGEDRLSDLTGDERTAADACSAQVDLDNRLNQLHEQTADRVQQEHADLFEAWDTDSTQLGASLE